MQVRLGTRCIFCVNFNISRLEKAPLFGSCRLHCCNIASVVQHSWKHIILGPTLACKGPAQLQEKYKRDTQIGDDLCRRDRTHLSDVPVSRIARLCVFRTDRSSVKTSKASRWFPSGWQCPRRLRGYTWRWLTPNNQMYRFSLQVTAGCQC